MKSILAIVAIAALSLSSSFAQSPANRGFTFYGDYGVASVAVGTAGTGYTSPPVVSFTGGSGGGVPPVATSTLKVVGTPTVTAGGTGYSTTQVLTVVGGTGTAATLTVSTVSSGVITAVTITTAGAYTVLPTNPVAVTGGAGTGATFTLGYGVGSVVVASAGSGYLTTPTVAFTGGAGSSAAATATLDSGATAANAVTFCEICPLTDSVLSAITYPARVLSSPTVASGAVPTVNYNGDGGLVGKTLKAGIVYRVYGTSATFSSGTGTLTLYPSF